MCYAYSMIDLRNAKVGLVLSGGGAKGAYHVGCVRALEMAGVTHYQVISGTSIGAVNGALIATSTPTALESVWKSIGLFDLFQMSWRTVIAIPAILPALYLHQFFSLIGLFVPLVTIFVIGFLFKQILWQFALCAVVVWAIPQFVFPSWAKKLIRGLAVVYLMRITPAFSILRSGKLKCFVRGSLSGVNNMLRNTNKLYFTTATLRRWFDPDNPSFLPRPFGGTIDTHYDIRYPTSRPGWLPRYVDAGRLPPDEVIDELIKCAALPILFTASQIDGSVNFDGGIVENTPLNKAIDEVCDIIFVIYLKPIPDAGLSTIDQIPRLRRALRLADSDQQQLHQKFINWLRASGRKENIFHDFNFPKPPDFTIEPIPPMPPLPRMIHIFPSDGLGSTFIFRKSKTRRLIKLGMLDTEKALSIAGFKIKQYS